MSVRRLAEDKVQPARFAFSGENSGWAERTIGKYPEGRQQSAVIPLLMRAQEQDGWVTRAAIEHVADMLKMPLIRVLEVATFYTQFQLAPVGTRAHVQVCGTTPCMLRGSDALKDVCREKIHPQQFHQNESGTLSWEEVECLGACVNAPMVMIFKDTYEDLTPERLGEIIEAFDRGEGASIPAGPQIDRQLSAPVGGATTLRSPSPAAPADGGGPAAGAADQGNGVGEALDPATSRAGRPNADAPETDASLDVPGKATEANVDPATGAAVRVDPSAGAQHPGAGSTGGSFQGPTGAGQRDADAEAASAKSADGSARHDGPLGEKGDAAEAAVVDDRRRVDAPEGANEMPHAPALPAAERVEAPVEANRVSEDVLGGPLATDHFETNADAARHGDKGVGHAQGGGHPETDGSRPMGEKPEGLLPAPVGPKDDLQRIKGVGPVLEVKLNELGVYHFRQIAGWTTAGLTWIDDHLNVRGRALRDRWIEQAKELSASAHGAGTD